MRLIWWCYIEVGFAKLLRFFGIRYSDLPIPKDTLYCYVIDEERNNKEPLEQGYWIKPCKYYRHINNSNAGCVYVGFIGFDPCFADQCKICGVSEDDDEEENIIYVKI